MFCNINLITALSRKHGKMSLVPCWLPNLPASHRTKWNWPLIVNEPPSSQCGGTNSEDLATPNSFFCRDWRYHVRCSAKPAVTKIKWKKCKQKTTAWTQGLPRYDTFQTKHESARSKDKQTNKSDLSPFNSLRESGWEAHTTTPDAIRNICPRVTVADGKYNVCSRKSFNH